MTEDLKKVKIEFLKEAAKLIGAIATLAIAVGGWLDSKTQANTALIATATEKATNEETYQALISRIAVLENLTQQMGNVAEEVDEELENYRDFLTRHDERLQILSAKHGFNYNNDDLRSEFMVGSMIRNEGPPEPSPNILLKDLMNKAKNKEPLAKERPKPKPHAVEQIQQAYDEGRF